MARGKSVIDVLIIGDAKKLVGAFNQVDQSTGGLLKSAAKLALTGVAIDKGFEFIQDSLGEADRLGDAMQRLNGQVGELDAQKLKDTASAFSDLGLSAQDVLELEAGFADLATSVGLSDDAITDFAPQAAAAAGALSLIREEDPSTIMDLIAKATGGSARAAKELGVALIDTKDPAAQFKNIMAQLAPQLDQVTKGGKDVEQQQRKLGAQWETLQANVGQLVEGPLTDLLSFINDEIEALPHAIEGFHKLGIVIVNAFENALSPLARLNDALGDLGDTLRSLPVVGNIFGGGGLSESEVRRLNSLVTERNEQGRP